MTFNRPVRWLEDDGFSLVKEKGSIRQDGKEGHPRLIRLDYQGSREVPNGTCRATLEPAEIDQP